LRRVPHDLAVIIVCHDQSEWLRGCLPTVLERAGDISVDVVVADNGTSPVTPAVTGAVPGVRLLRCENHGFGHANNRAWMTCDARYAFFLNPDTVVCDGTLAAVVRRLDELPHVGMAGVIQLGADGTVLPTMRRFPGPLRQLGDALGSERWPRRPSWAGERETRLSRYAQEFELDWTSGAAMLVRREALESAGLFDERMFMFSEKTDLARRVRAAGWRVRHLPQATVVHFAPTTGWSARRQVQYAVARRYYARRHMGPVRRRLYLAAVALRALLRAALFATALRGRPDAGEARAGQLRAALALAGRVPSPYQPDPPAVALRLREDAPADR
jgi:GT2 family glycosyltransferase